MFILLLGSIVLSVVCAKCPIIELVCLGKVSSAERNREEERGRDDAVPGPGQVRSILFVHLSFLVTDKIGTMSNCFHG